MNLPDRLPFAIQFLQYSGKTHLDRAGLKGNHRLLQSHNDLLCEQRRARRRRCGSSVVNDPSFTSVYLILFLTNGYPTAV